MTTIAYRNGIMACDSCWTSRGDLQYTSLSKIRRLASGGLLGQAGTNDSREIDKLLDGVRKPEQLPMRPALYALSIDFIGILVLPAGRVFMVASREDAKDFEDEVGIWELNRDFASCGSGGDIALGAMAAGASAERAVEIACQFDINSRPPVHEVALAMPGARRRRRRA